MATLVSERASEKEDSSGRQKRDKPNTFSRDNDDDEPSVRPSVRSAVVSRASRRRTHEVTSAVGPSVVRRSPLARARARARSVYRQTHSPPGCFSLGRTVRPFWPGWSAGTSLCRGISCPCRRDRRVATRVAPTVRPVPRSHTVALLTPVAVFSPPGRPRRRSQGRSSDDPCARARDRARQSDFAPTRSRFFLTHASALPPLPLQTARRSSRTLFVGSDRFAARLTRPSVISRLTSSDDSSFYSRFNVPFTYTHTRVLRTVTLRRLFTRRLLKICVLIYRPDAVRIDRPTTFPPHFVLMMTFRFVEGGRKFSFYSKNDF